MATNQAGCSRSGQKSVVQFLLVQKCKPCDIYRRMCDVYGEASFSQRNFSKLAKHGFATTNRTEVCHQIFVS